LEEYAAENNFDVEVTWDAEKQVFNNETQRFGQITETREFDIWTLPNYNRFYHNEAAKDIFTTKGPVLTVPS